MREITARHGIVLIFDEVKTGLAIAAGGATERFGVKPDMVTLAKTLGGGLPVGRDRRAASAVMSVVEDGSVYQVGTYNGNPLTMAAARASLEQVLTPAAYRHLDALNERILAGCEAVIARHRLPGYAVGIGSKGCVTFSPVPIVDYESLQGQPGRRRHRARVAVEHEPRHLHDARARGGVDAVGDAHATRRSTTTCAPSTRWRRRSPRDASGCGAHERINETRGFVDRLPAEVLRARRSASGSWRASSDPSPPRGTPTVARPERR